ncbi:hypothetical protein [Brevifollis gellanilyticus]|nr:hypothetical protein [Brevifollis gellanilyticus]
MNHSTDGSAEHRIPSGSDACESGESRRNAKDPLQELAVFAQTLPGPGACADAEEWFSAQSESLVSWARREQWLVDASELEHLTAGLKRLEGGLEHRVFFHEEMRRVLKITKAPFFGTQVEAWRYARNALWANLLFGDDIRLEGILLTQEGASIVISQPLVQGDSPTLEQIAQWFTDQGYRADGFNKWCNEAGTVIADTHPGNFIRIEDGTLIPIDLQILSVGAADL